MGLACRRQNWFADKVQESIALLKNKYMFCNLQDSQQLIRYLTTYWLHKSLKEFEGNQTNVYQYEFWRTTHSY